MVLGLGGLGPWWWGRAPVVISLRSYWRRWAFAAVAGTGQAVKQRTADTFGFWRGNSPFNQNLMPNLVRVERNVL